jgi:hypothetical protein
MTAPAPGQLWRRWSANCTESRLVVAVSVPRKPGNQPRVTWRNQQYGFTAVSRLIAWHRWCADATLVEVRET